MATTKGCCVICQQPYDDEAIHMLRHGRTVGERMDAWLKAELQRSEKVNEMWHGSTQVAEHALAIICEKTIDHQALLVKYIRHVSDQEGASFLSDHWKDDQRFTAEEWAELQRCDKESET